MNPDKLRRRLHRGTLLLAAWAPLGLLWVAFLMVDYGLPLGAALAGAARNVGLAALLGLGVWLVSGKLPWPERRPWTFYALHLLLAVGFSALWLALSTPLAVVFGEQGPRLVLGHYRPLGWRFAVGVWLYGLVAGVSYALRARAELAAREKAAAELRALATQARLDALVARMDPHFLFNALHSVSALVRRRPGEAQSALEELGSLLRYCLQRAARDSVALREEYGFTQRYLALEQRRLGQRLRVEYDLDPSSLDAAVPPLALQPLVENAVRHGIAPLATGGSMVVRSRCCAPWLELAVINDFDPTGHDTGGCGSGLETLRERLEARFGDAARLVAGVSPKEPRRFRVDLRLPLMLSAAELG